MPLAPYPEAMSSLGRQAGGPGAGIWNQLNPLVIFCPHVIWELAAMRVFTSSLGNRQCVCTKRVATLFGGVFLDLVKNPR